MPTEYVVANYRMRAEELATRFEQRAAPKFDRLHPTWRVVAIRLPESCDESARATEGRDESAGQGTGIMSKDKDKLLLRTNCGFWLAELERGLVAAKYTVVSWNALRQVEQTRHVPSHVAAHDLGADVVFIINSLEGGTTPVAENAFRESIKYYNADADGKTSTPAQLADDERSALRGFIGSKTSSLRDDLKEHRWVSYIKAMLDVTAVDAASGEAVWFYLKLQAKPVQVARDARFLFGHLRGDDQYWPVLPRWLKSQTKAAAAMGKSSEDMNEGEWKSPPASAYDEEVHQMERAVVEDFLTHFRGKEG